MPAYVRFALIRAGGAALTLLGVSLVIFAALHALPGSFEEVLMPQGSPELRARIAEKFGLDRPLPVQYLDWLSASISGDFGVSLITQHPVWEEFSTRIPVTAELALLATAISILVGVPLGVASGLTGARRHIAAASRIGVGLAMSVPDFVLGSLLLYIFSRYSLGLTVGNWVYFADDPIGNLAAALLPALTLSTLGIGLLMATTRHAVISILAQDFIMAAIARGKSRWQIVRQHVLRNAGIPVITVVAIYSGYLLGGTVIVETLYSVPGLGRHIVQGVLYRDYPVVQAGILLGATFFIALNMAADLTYALIDPRRGAQRWRS